MVDGDRPKWRAIDRNEQRMLSHREISSRSERLRACLARCRSGGRMPPVGEITEKTDEDSRSNRRPIELIDSPACQRSHTAEPQNFSGTFRRALLPWSECPSNPMKVYKRNVRLEKVANDNDSVGIC